jgi:hypothetical protein
MLCQKLDILVTSEGVGNGLEPPSGSPFRDGLLLVFAKPKETDVAEKQGISCR